MIIGRIFLGALLGCVLAIPLFATDDVACSTLLMLADSGRTHRHVFRKQGNILNFPFLETELGVLRGPDASHGQFEPFAASRDQLVGQSVVPLDQLLHIGRLERTPGGPKLEYLPVSEVVRSRITSFMQSGATVGADQGGLEVVGFLAGWHPWIPQFSTFTLTADRQVRNLLTIGPVGTPVAVLNGSTCLTSGIYLGDGHFLFAIPQRGLVITTYRQLMDVLDHSELVVLGVKPEFRAMLPDYVGSDLGQWNDLKGKPLSWSDYDLLFGENISGVLRNSTGRAGHRVAALLALDQAMGHPDLQLETKWGMSFATESSDSRILRLSDIVTAGREEQRRYTDRTERHWDVVRVFKDAAGRDHIVRWGERFDPQWTEYDSGFLPAAVMGKLLLQRLIPISIRRGFHDLRHYTGLIQYFEQYGEPFAKLVEAMDREKAVFGQMDRLARVVYAYETLALVPRENRTELRALLSHSFRSPRGIPTVARVAERLKQLNFRFELVPHARKLLRGYRSLLRAYGGAARDPSLGLFSSSRIVREGPTGMAERLEDMLDCYENPRHVSPDRFHAGMVAAAGGIQGAIQKELARLEVFLWGSTTVTAKEFLEELADPALTRESSKIVPFLLDSGVLEDIDTEGYISSDLNLGWALFTKFELLLNP